VSTADKNCSEHRYFSCLQQSPLRSFLHNRGYYTQYWPRILNGHWSAFQVRCTYVYILFFYAQQISYRISAANLLLLTIWTWRYHELIMSFEWSLWDRGTCTRWWLPISTPYILFLYQQFFCLKFQIAILGGGCKPPILEKGEGPKLAALIR